MMGRLSGALCAAMLLAAPRPAAAFLYVSGDDHRSGDLVAVWVKNGFELIRNLGPVQALNEGVLIPSLDLPPQFADDASGANLSRAKFIALAVPNPVQQFANLPPQIPPPFYQPNIALTTLGDPSTIAYFQVGAAQGVLEPPTQGLDAWLLRLNTIPPANGTDVIENTDAEMVISTSQFASYTNVLGQSGDHIGSTISLSTSVSVAGPSYSIPLYLDFVTADFSDVNNITFDTRVTGLGSLTGNAGSGGHAMLSLPEPGETALGAGALLALAIARRLGSAKAR